MKISNICKIDCKIDCNKYFMVAKIKIKFHLPASHCIPIRQRDEDTPSNGRREHALCQTKEHGEAVEGVIVHAVRYPLNENLEETDEKHAHGRYRFKKKSDRLKMKNECSIRSVLLQAISSIV